MKMACGLPVLVIAVLVALAPRALGDTIVAPGENDGWNFIPFSSWYGDGDGRYQQVYDATVFSGPVSVEAIAFSVNERGPTAPPYAANIQISLAPTTAPVGGLSTTLDSNVTTPLTIVFNDPNFSQVTTGGVDAFGLVFDFSSSPFGYDPADGNLLLDIVISDMVPYATRYVSSSYADGSLHPLVSSRAYVNQGAPRGFADTGGLRTQFTTSASTVPLPSAAWAGLGLLSVIGAIRWCRRRARSLRLEG